MITGKFQLTRPRGARLSPKIQTNPNKRISTHTPAWGATARAMGDAGIETNFNSHARVGRDYLTY